MGSGGGSATSFGGSATKGGGFTARGAEKRAGGLPPGRCAWGRSACEPRYGRAPFGRSPEARDFANGLLTRRLMVVAAPNFHRWVAQKHGIVTANQYKSRTGSVILGESAKKPRGASR